MTTIGCPTTLSIDVASLEDADALAMALQEFCAPDPLTVSQFEIPPLAGGAVLGWRIDAYFNTAPDADALRAHLGTAVTSDLPELSLVPTPEENWVAVSQAALPPVHAGRFHIHGSHDRHRASQGIGAIEIEAGEAFGTAHHATTYLCLEVIDILTRQKRFKHALDLGCGSGVLAIALARVAPGCAILATDIDEKAVEVTRQNARLNRVGARIETHVVDGLLHPRLRAPGRFDLVVANILAGPLIELARGIARISKPRAIVVLSGLLTDQASEVVAAYRASGFSVLEHRRREEWSALVLVKS